MSAVLPQLPPQKTPITETEDSLFARIWWMFLDSLTKAVSSINDTLAAFMLRDFVFGGSKLVTIGAIPVVTAAGILGQSSLADDGTAVRGTEPLRLDTGATPAASQIALAANLLGALQLLCYAADLSEIVFDVNYTGSALIARNATTARISKIGGKLNFHYGFGQTVGNPLTDAVSATLDLATGKWGFLQAAPAEVVDVTGNVNATGVYKKGGVAGISATAVLAKVTPGGANGSLTVSGGIITAYTAPT